MSLISNYPNGFANGISIRGMPLLQTHPGNVFWVYNGTTLDTGHKNGSNNNKGTFDAPFATLEYALSQCRTNKGDIIFIKPGHAETVSSATALNFDVGGVAIVGLGAGLNRPTFTFDTATTATIPVTAANMTVSNCIFTANFADIVSTFTLAAAKDFCIDGCLIKATATNMNFLHVIDTGTTDNSTDGFTFINSQWFEPDAATLAFALLDSAADRWHIENNTIVTGNATADTAALITGATGKNLTNVRILKNNIDVTGNATSTAGILITTDGTAGTGIIAYNNIKHLDATTEVLITATHTFGLFENRATAVANAQGYLLPAIDS